MKKLTMLILVVLLIIINSVPVSARPEYSEETKRLMREAGLRTESADWDEIARRQQEYRNRRNQSAAPRDTRTTTGSSTRAGRSVKTTDTTDELHIYSNQSTTQPRSYGSKNNYASRYSYGSKYSYDEFHTAPKDIQANDGYGSGGFDELHINENYRQNVWHPEHRGNRLRGFDEFRYPDEM